MASVRLEILPGLGEALTPGNRERRHLELPLGAQHTWRELFADLVARDDMVGLALFDAREQALYSHVRLSLNGRLVAPDRALSMAANDGDRLVLFPVYAGG